MYQLSRQRPQNFLKNPMFSIERPMRPMLTLPGQPKVMIYSQPKVMIYTNYNGPVPDATYQVLLKSVQQFQRRRFLRVFTIYGHGSHLGHVTLTIYTKIDSLFQRIPHIKFGFDW